MLALNVALGLALLGQGVARLLADVAMSTGERLGAMRLVRGSDRGRRRPARPAPATSPPPRGTPLVQDHAREMLVRHLVDGHLPITQPRI